MTPRQLLTESVRTGGNGLKLNIYIWSKFCIRSQKLAFIRIDSRRMREESSFTQELLYLQCSEIY